MLLTAEQALKMSGKDSELLLIDEEIRSVARLSRRLFMLNTERIPHDHIDDVCLSLSERGFKVERLNNPYRIKVSW